MNFSEFLRAILRVALLNLLCLAGLTAQDHSHLNAGGQGLLVWDNGADFAPPYALQLKYNSGANKYGAAGYLWDGNLTFTALSLEEDNDSGAGSFLQVRLLSVTGPSGATFTFWERNATSPTHVAATGSSNLGYLWNLTTGTPGSTPPADPGGQVHGRRFAVNQPGEYTATFQVIDYFGATTGNQPSMPLTLSFIAVIPEPGTGSALLLAGACWLATRRRRRSA